MPVTMSVDSKDDDFIEEEAKNTDNESGLGTLDELFKERDSKDTRSHFNSISKEKEEDNSEQEKEIKHEIKPVNKELPKTKKTDDIREDKETKEVKESQKEEKVNKQTNKKDQEDEDDERVLEINKLKKEVNDNRRWAQTNNRRLKGVAKVIESLKEEGIIDDENFDKLNGLLNVENPEELENNETDINNPIKNLINIASSKLTDLHTIYEDDEFFDQKIASFNAFMKDCSQEEFENIVDELEEFKDNPLKLVKRMYKIGEEYYQDYYKEILDAGGFKKVIAKKNEDISKMKKKIDKLEKQLLEYNGYDKPTNNHRIDELGDTENEKEGVRVQENQTGIQQFISERDRRR